MWHGTCRQGNRGDSRLLMVGSQIGNLTPDPSFGQNLCIKCPNGSCKPILDIYSPRAFQWYNELFNPMGFEPLQLLSIDLKVHRDSNSQSGSSFGNVGFIPSHSLTLSGAWNVTPSLHTWPGPSQAFTLVASPRFGLRHLFFHFFILGPTFGFLEEFGGHIRTCVGVK
jgi:hypothetical protein